jgi:hypothetical protein
MKLFEGPPHTVICPLPPSWPCCWRCTRPVWSAHKALNATTLATASRRSGGTLGQAVGPPLWPPGSQHRKHGEAPPRLQHKSIVRLKPAAVVTSVNLQPDGLARSLFSPLSVRPLNVAEDGVDLVGAALDLYPLAMRMKASVHRMLQR